MSANPVRLGVIGLGHWGPNHVRVFGQTPGARVVAAADPAPDRRRHVAGLYPSVDLVAAAADVLARDDVDAVVIATPARSHFELASAAIAAGKHVLLEKPMCTSIAEARALDAAARAASRVLVHGHVFVYNSGVRYVREGFRRGDFGAVQYVHATRTNLGPIRTDVNVVEDLASHDLAIFDYLFGCAPNWVSATGSRLLGTDREDVAFVTLEYGAAMLAHVHVSWLNPQKVRTLTLVGSQRMVVWDDTQSLEPVRVYDKGLMQEPYYDSFGEFQLRLRDGDIVIPKIHSQEPLKVQAEAFVRRLTEGEPTPSEGATGVRLVACLHAIHESLAAGGRRVAPIVDAVGAAEPV
jgi:predicted dehydrogenase